MRRRVVKAVRVKRGQTSPVTPYGRAFSAAASVGASADGRGLHRRPAPLPTFGEGKGVVDTPRTVKPGEKIVVEAMRVKRGQTSPVTPYGRAFSAAASVGASADGRGLHRRPAPLPTFGEGKETAGTEKASTWRRFREDPPEPRQLIAMAEYSRISRRWTYWATRLERDAIEFWKSADSDVRWAPLPELLVGDEEPEVKA